jgi:hypothetical protein
LDVAISTVGHLDIDGRTQPSENWLNTKGGRGKRINPLIGFAGSLAKIQRVQKGAISTIG